MKVVREFLGWSILPIHLFRKFVYFLHSNEFFTSLKTRNKSVCAKSFRFFSHFHLKASHIRSLAMEMVYFKRKCYIRWCRGATKIFRRNIYSFLSHLFFRLPWLSFRFKKYNTRVPNRMRFLYIFSLSLCWLRCESRHRSFIHENKFSYYYNFSSFYFIRFLQISRFLRNSNISKINDLEIISKT